MPFFLGHGSSCEGEQTYSDWLHNCPVNPLLPAKGLINHELSPSDSNGKIRGESNTGNTGNTGNSDGNAGNNNGDNIGNSGGDNEVIECGGG